MALKMDEDHLDQVFTNNESDEACLRDVLERYMDNGDYQHSWEEIVSVLIKIDEKNLADKIHGLYVYPCKFDIVTIFIMYMHVFLRGS